MPLGQPKYKPTPTQQERAYHIWLMDHFVCACGCGGMSEVVHHPLECHPEQRWRRDHEFVVPMTWHCHSALHAHGAENIAPFTGMAEKAFHLRQSGIECDKLTVRLAA